MAEHEAGWHAYSPQDPDLPDNLRRLHRRGPHPVARGEVHVVVYELEPGQSEVRVRVHPAEAAQGGLSETTLIDAAIAELRLTRQAFANENDG